MIPRNYPIDKTHTVNGRYIHIPLADALIPKDGRRCFTDRFWVITGDNELLCFDGYCSPQCNKNEDITRRLAHICAPETYRCIFLPVVYIPFVLSDYDL